MFQIKSIKIYLDEIKYSEYNKILRWIDFKRSIYCRYGHLSWRRGELNSRRMIVRWCDVTAKSLKYQGEFGVILVKWYWVKRGKSSCF